MNKRALCATLLSSGPPIASPISTSRTDAITLCAVVCAPVFDPQDISAEHCLHGEGCFLSSEGWASCAEGTVTGLPVCIVSTGQKDTCTFIFSKKEEGAQIHVAKEARQRFIIGIQRNVNLLAAVLLPIV